jgi:hypothetical protein
MSQTYGGDFVGFRPILSDMLILRVLDVFFRLREWIRR